MSGGVLTHLLVTVTLLVVTQTGTQCRAENDFSLVTLPDWRPNSDYVTQCFYDSNNNMICDWNQQRTESVLQSGPVGMEGEACLEFWYSNPLAAHGSELHVLLKSSVGLMEIWTSSVLPKDTWRQVFVPLDIIEPQTQVVIKAVSKEGQFTFSRIGVRRGSCGPQCQSDTELWTDESTRCLCSGGQLSCSPSQCSEGQICRPQIRTPRRINAPGICTIHSHTDCSTFDGVLFRFVVPCTYTLAKTCSPSEALPRFSVEVVNEQSWNLSLPTVQQVTVDVGNFRVSLLRGQTHRVVVNGVWKKLPLKLNSGTVSINGNPAAVELETSFGLSVSCDKAGAVHIALPSSYSEKVCGLCGNFNHLYEDDFRKPDGTNASDATALAESWQTGPTTSSCETVVVPQHCGPQETEEYASELNCGGLLSSTGPFADCLSVLGAESYFRGCMASMCSTHGDPAVVCQTLQVYAEMCQEAGVAVPIWRNSTFCPLLCGENSHYNSCADGCPEVCSSLDTVGYCGSCEERCECDYGFKLSGGKCVPAEDCGCWYNGEHYEKGAALWEGECEQQCQCMGNNDMQCTTVQCADHEVCKVKDGAKGCFLFAPATCSVYGDPHYITFDGMAYDFQGGCSYTLTTTCGGESSVQFAVIGHNMHPPTQNFTRSKLEAVTLQADDLYLTLNQSGAVYVDNSSVRLPYSTNGTYGSVWVTQKKNYIILETTFGLRMMIDAQNRLFLQVDEHYKYELCGLCGTYSERQDDDFVTPGGQNATGPFEFGHSWKVSDNNECVSHPNDPRVCDYHEQIEAYNECDILLDDAFKPCHGPVHPSTYLNSCAHDYCATSGDQHTLCESLKSYAAACQVAGVELPHWQTNTACADPPTTATLPTSSTPTPNPTLCPINCDFEKNMCGWEQLIQDSFDWTMNSGATPSKFTGPNQDHTTGAGFYIYIEGNSVTHGDSARLLSSMCHYSGPLCLHFWYHMYGSATAMALNMYLLKDNKATKVWSMMNNQGPEWHLGNVEISVTGPFQIIAEGIRGSNALSDVAIDDISIHFGSCSGSFPGLVSGTEISPTEEVVPEHSVCNIDCSFDSNLCSWKQMVTDVFDWTWQSGSTPTTMTGPSADHTGDGHYLYTEGNSASYGDTARLISSECSDSGPQCLQFWYHMYGSADTMGLHVYLLQNRSAEDVWWMRNDQGNAWRLAQVDFTTTGTFQIIIEGRRGSNEKSDVAIDDVKLYRGQCSDVSPPKPDGNTTLPSVPSTTTTATEPPLVNVTDTPPVEEANTNVTINNVTESPDNRQPSHSECQLNCNFEQDICQWSQLLTDVFDWTRHRGSTPTMMTGPSSDHTTGDGHYLYTEGNSASYGDTARLISSECSDSGPQCLQFWYHMYGSADTMGLNVYLLQDRNAVAVWRKRNDQGNMWHLAQVDFTTTGAFKIIFEGRIGSNDQSDVAIDDVLLHRGHCSGGAQPTTTARPQPTTTARPQPTTTARPQPTTTAGPQPTTTAGQQPTTTAGPQPTTTARPQPTTTARPQPTTTAGPQPTTTVGQQPTTTAGPQPTTPVEPQPTTTPGPQPTTPAGPQLTTPAGSQPTTPAGPQPTTTAGPQPTTTAGPQPTTPAGQQPTTPAGPQPTTTPGPQPTTPAEPKPTTTPAEPQPTTPAEPQPTTTPGPQPTTPAEPQPTTPTEPTIPAEPTTPAEPQPTTPTEPTIPAEPTTPAEPQPTIPAETQPTTPAEPQPTTPADPQPTTPAEPQPTTPAEPQPTTPADPQPTTPAEPQPTTPAEPQPTTPAGLQPTTPAEPQPTNTGEAQTTPAEPQPTTPAEPQPTTPAEPQPTTPAEPQPTTPAEPQPTTPAEPQPTKPAEPQPTTPAEPQPTTPAGPQPTTTHVPQPTTPAEPQPTTPAEPQPTTPAGPQPTTPAGPQPTTPAEPQPTTPAEPQPTNTGEAQTTPAGPQPTRPAGPQPTTTAGPQPTTTAGPQPTTTAPTCPENSHHTTCAPTCSPTCRHLNGPQNCSDHDSCMPGCVCDEGFVWKQRNCVPLQHCGCVDSNGIIYSFNDVWYTDHCSQRCECEKDDGVGEIDCDDKYECDGNAVCLQNQDGDYYCQSTEFHECTISGDSEYKTFDKMKYDFEGEHSYVLVRTKNLPNNLPHVYIEGINNAHTDDDSSSSSEENHSHMDSEEEDDDDDDEDDGDSEEHKEHHRLQKLEIRVYNHTVELKKNRRLVVNGRRTKTPASPMAGLKIWEHSSRIYLQTDFGLLVEFDGHSTAEISLPRLYKMKVEGLCGNYDGFRKNDKTKPDGTKAKTVQEFGESWRV